MYDFNRLPKELHKKYIEHYEKLEMQDCFNIISQYNVNDTCNTCHNLYELKTWTEWALKNGILSKD